MKIAKGIASVLKTIGLVVMAIAIVMSIYVVANDGAGWSTLSGALRSYQQNASVVTRAWFDKQYFSAMIDAASTKTLGGDVRQNRALTFYTTWVNELAAGQDALSKQKLDAFCADFDQNFDVDAYLTLYEQQESGSDSRLLAESFDYLNKVMTPAAPKGKPIKIATANTEPDVAAFYETFAQEHGEEAGSYLEFVETLTTMVRASVDAGNKPASMKKYLNALTFEDYAAALAEQRTLERVDTEDIRDEFAALVEQKKQGEAIDLEAFVQSKYEALQARYPSENLGTLDVFATTLLERMQSEDFDGSLSSLLKAVQVSVAAAPTYQTALKSLAETTVKKSDDSNAISLVIALWWLAARWVWLWLVGIVLLVIARVMNAITDKVTLARLEHAGIEEEGDVLLRVNHLKQYFRSGDYINKAVDDVSFYIKKGEVFGLVGESGCGKTTTGRTIINLYDPTEGDVYFQGLRISSTQNGLPVLIRSLKNDFEEKQRQMKAALKEKTEKNPAQAAALKAEYDQKIKEMRKELKEKIRQARTNALESSVEKSKCVEKYREKRKAELTAAFEADSKTLSHSTSFQRDTLLDFLRTGKPSALPSFWAHYRPTIESGYSSFVYRCYLYTELFFVVHEFCQENRIPLPESLRQEDLLEKRILLTNSVDDFLTLACQLCEEVMEVRPGGSRHTPSAEQARAYIDRHYMDPELSLSSVANAVSVSPNHLSTLFKSKIGVGFSEYLTEV